MNNNSDFNTFNSNNPFNLDNNKMNNKNTQFNVGNNDLHPGVNKPFDFDSNDGNQIGPNHPSFSSTNVRRPSTTQPPNAKFDPFGPDIHNESSNTGEPNPSHFKPPDNFNNKDRNENNK